MPYVAPDEALQLRRVNLAELQTRQGPPPWRVPIAGSGGLRAVVLAWEPGHVEVPHRHPRADELFHVLSGRALFRFGAGPEIEAGPGDVLFSGRGEEHVIRLLGDEPVYLLIVVAPNEDLPDETIEAELAPGQSLRPGSPVGT